MSDSTFDLAVIGSGPGGYVAAIRASQLGLKTVLIEKDKPGGVCLNIGCIPSKALLHQAELFRSIAELRNMGLSIDSVGFNYSKVWQKSRDVAARLSRGVQGLIKKNQIDYKAGTAVISAPGVIQVQSSTGEDFSIQAKNILIATGSRPKTIPGYEFDGETVISSNDLLMLETLPKSLIILGAGAIGVEFACIMASFGVQVSLVEMAPRILPSLEADIVKVLDGNLRKMGINILTGCKAGALDYIDEGVGLEVNLPDGSIKTLVGQKILIATGRSANIEKLGLESIGIQAIKGCIPVNDFYETKVKGIYAIGDVLDTPQLAHLASKEGEIAVEHMAGHDVPTTVDPDSVPAAVYANPEIASFGKTEDQIKTLGIDYQAYSFPFAGVGKAVASDASMGLVKVLVSKQKIIAAHIVGPSATDLIHELLLARNAQLKPEDIATMIHAHPTYSEGIMEAARGIEGWAIHV